MIHVTKVNSLILTLSLSVVSCQLKVEPPPAKNLKVPMLESQDTNLLKKMAKPFSDYKWAKNNLAVAQDSEALLTQSLSLKKVSLMFGDSVSFDLAKDLFKEYKNKSQFKTNSLSNSEYLTLVTQESDEALSQGLSATEQRVLADTEIVKKIVLDEGQNLKLVQPELEFEKQLEFAHNYINQVILKIETYELFPELKTEVLSQLKQQSQAQLSPAQQLSIKLQKATLFGEAIQNIQAYVKAEQTQLDPTDELKLTQSVKLAQMTEAIQDEKSALAALTMAWSMLNDEERIKSFKSANEKLYDYLKKQSDKEIACFITESCKGFFKKIVLNVGVYPALKDYGLENIKKTLNTEALLAARLSVQKNAASTLKNLPLSISTQLETSVQQKLTALYQFKQNFQSQLALGISKNLGFSQSNLFYSENTVTFAGQFQKNYAQAQFVTTLDTEAQFNLIENMLLFFSRGTALNFQTTSAEPIKDVLVKAEPRVYKNRESTEIKALDQMWSLRFYSKMISLLADWKETLYDQGLSKLSVQSFITDFKSPELERSLFPKSDLLGISVSLAAQTLKQFQTEFSPIYLIGKDNLRVSLKDYLAQSNQPASTVLVQAAVSDLTENRLSETTKLSDMNETLLALNEFYQATFEIEKSPSAILQDPNLRQDLLNSRQQVKLITLALANFISNKLIDDQRKTLFSEYHFSAVTNENSQTAEANNLQTQTAAQIASQAVAQIRTPAYLLSDYTNTIEALMTAYDITGIEIYKLTAIELYYTINRVFYNSVIRFYSTSLLQAPLPPVDKTVVLKTLSQVGLVRPYLPLTSQIQFDRIFENWFAAVLL